jgi:hypothetical protein
VDAYRPKSGAGALLAEAAAQMTIYVPDYDCGKSSPCH